MKLSHLPAAFYGVSSSKPSTLAYNNYQRRCFRRRIPIPSASASASASALTLISTSTSTSISTKGRNELQHGRCFQSSLSPLASHNRRGFHHRYCYHQYRNLDHNLFPIHSADEDNVNTNPHRISQQRRGICLSGTANNSIHNNTANADTNDPGDASATTTATTTRNFGAATHRGNNAEPSEKRSKYPRVPKLRLFYNDVYEVKLPPNHRFPMGKYRKVREKVQNKIAKLPQETRDSVDCDFQVSPLSTFEELSTTHDPTYIQRFLEGDQTEREQRNVGFPWSNEGVDRALSSVGGTLAAACFVCEHERQKRLESRGTSNASATATNKSFHESFPPTWAAHIAGGTHHAFYDYGEGFSVFSDMAVAANVVLDKYPDIITNNILMIDLDVHQGNGNAVLFQPQQEPSSQSSSSSHQEEEGETTTGSVSVKKKNKYADRVFTFSMHCSGNYFSQKQESDLDIELPIGCKDQAYLMTLNHWLKRFRAEHHKAGDKGGSNKQQPEPSQKYRWDLVIFQAGVDVLDDDRLGRMALSPGAVARRNELVYEFAFDLGVPLVICMGGGYPKNDNAWESITEAHSDVYVGAHNFLSRLSASKNSGISEMHTV